MVEMLFRGGLDKALTFSYDDGLPADLRLKRIFDAHGLKATFNINSTLSKDAENLPLPDKTVKENMWTRYPLDKYVSEFRDSDHEIALHGAKHRWPDKMDSATAREEYESDKAALEKAFGRVIRGCAYAMGTYGDAAIAELKRLGIHYARAVFSTLSFDIPTDRLTYHPTCHHSNLDLNKGVTLMEMGKKFLADKSGKAKLFYVWGHSAEFEVDNNWNIIEEFADFISGRDDIWYATNIDIFRYVEDFERLEFSSDKSLVYNPSANDVWLSIDGKVKVALSGKTTDLTE